MPITAPPISFSRRLFKTCFVKLISFLILSPSSRSSFVFHFCKTHQLFPRRNSISFPIRRRVSSASPSISFSILPSPPAYQPPARLPKSFRRSISFSILPLPPPHISNSFPPIFTRSAFYDHISKPRRVPPASICFFSVSFSHFISLFRFLPAVQLVRRLFDNCPHNVTSAFQFQF